MQCGATSADFMWIHELDASDSMAFSHSGHPEGRMKGVSWAFGAPVFVNVGSRSVTVSPSVVIVVKDILASFT